MKEECFEKWFNIFGFLQLIFFKELNMLEGLSDLDLPLDSLEEHLDGDIFVFQKKLDVDEKYRLPTCKDFFKPLFYKVRWIFVYQKSFIHYLLHVQKGYSTPQTF